jgi:hypothetical protein
MVTGGGSGVGRGGLPAGRADRERLSAGCYDPTLVQLDPGGYMQSPVALDETASATRHGNRNALLFAPGKRDFLLAEDVWSTAA